MGSAVAGVARAARAVRVPLRPPQSPSPGRLRPVEALDEAALVSGVWDDPAGSGPFTGLGPGLKPRTGGTRHRRRQRLVLARQCGLT